MNTPSSKRFLTVAEAVELGLYPNQGGLRWLIFNAEHNGLKTALRRVGRRILIDGEEFIRWVDRQSDIKSIRPIDPSSY